MAPVLVLTGWTPVTPGSETNPFHSLCCRPLLLTRHMLHFYLIYLMQRISNHSMILYHHWSRPSSVFVLLILFSYLPLSTHVLSVGLLSLAGPSVIYFTLSLTCLTNICIFVSLGKQYTAVECVIFI